MESAVLPKPEVESSCVAKLIPPPPLLIEPLSPFNERLFLSSSSEDNSEGPALSVPSIEPPNLLPTSRPVCVWGWPECNGKCIRKAVHHYCNYAELVFLCAQGRLPENIVGLPMNADGFFKWW